MITTRQYIFLFLILVAGTSFIHKDLNEYGKWLQFYNLKGEDFAQVGKEKQEDLIWEVHPQMEIYRNFYFYSPDSSYYLDLDSYSLSLLKDSAGNSIWPKPLGNKVVLGKCKAPYGADLLYFGAGGFPETAIWRNDHLLEICGFLKTEDETKYIPTIWKYNFETMISQKFQSKTTFKKLSKTYTSEVRLSSIKEKH